MTHPITPPPELVGEWLCDDGYPWDPSENATITITTNRLKNVATQAARWGADQELEACCEWFAQDWSDTETAAALRTARRPKPPSLAEQALFAIDEEQADLTLVNYKVIRTALERLQELEQSND